jgi:hypothetical protein
LIMTVHRLAGIPALALSVLAVSSSPPASAAQAAYLRASGSYVAAGTADASLCTTGSSNGNVNTCITWSNSGIHINYIIGSATVINVARTIKVCIRSDVRGTLACDRQGYIRIRPNESISVRWAPNASEPAGTYCMRTWRDNNNGSVTLIGQICTVIAPS